MKNIVIFGNGGHAKVVADIILKRKEILKEDLNIICFLDKDCINKEILKIPVLKEDEFFKKNLKDKNYEYIIAIGDALIREKIAKKYKGLKYYTAIHPTAVIGNQVTIGKGTVIMANVVINPCSKIGKHCILNTSCIVEHDNKIGDYVHISVGAKTAGTVKIGKYSWVGISVSINNNISVCSNCMIGAGGVVVKNIHKAGTYIGIPVKKWGGGQQ